jgi:succinate dehydrogenase/fumarate reductase flavoprotein subunit
MEKARAYFQTLQWILDTPTYDEELLELQNLITISMLITEFSLKRTGSRGAHFRQDFPEKDTSEVGHYTLTIGMQAPLLNPQL